MTRRGRPSLYPDDFYDFVVTPLCPQYSSKRGKQNATYMFQAMQALESLGPDAADFFGIGSSPKTSLLVELGRLKDHDAIRRQASLIIEQESSGHHLSIKEREKELRRQRLAGNDIP